MNKIMVIGVSAGAGKSTFARRLGELTCIEVTYLDRLYWKPDWVEASLEDFSEAQQQVVQNAQWIIEGNYTGTINIREPHVDTVIYLELPLRVCLYRVLKRRVQYHGKVRQDIGEGCKEKMDKAFLKFIVTTYGARKKTMIERMQRYAQEGKTVHFLKNRKQIEGFLETYIKN
ncbi:topology modulation protein [Sporosarcina sp. ANT_H38]|uniref:topology modulation protein n=1 Tax=Sporosarcina sp. ANT_H38 TaxID=2597358 RepID=UPI0011F1069B|nr:topology modulation protein [Sporosarcina sp. ANT_H38]KAA0955869.1 topology modulation protein [Sporosarcina sp. ANT_H38]